MCAIIACPPDINYIVALFLVLYNPIFLYLLLRSTLYFKDTPYFDKSQSLFGKFFIFLLILTESIATLFLSKHSSLWIENVMKLFEPGSHISVLSGYGCFLLYTKKAVPKSGQLLPYQTLRPGCTFFLSLSSLSFPTSFPHFRANYPQNT